MDALLYSPFVSQQIAFMLADLTPDDLNVIRDMAQAGTISSVLDRHYALHEVPEAIHYLELGHARGKVVIAVDADSSRDGAVLEPS
jgi:NADPH:quinone reductase-like Zn-dependent oxidoreductase